jgi:hypothetical protein
MEWGRPVSAVRIAAADDPTLTWGDAALGRYAAALSALPSADRLANAAFDVCALQLSDRTFPVVAPTGAAPQAWPLSLRTVYGPVGREEIRRYVSGPGRGLYAFAAHGAQAWLGATGADGLVLVNHALMSTSLYGGWDGTGLKPALDALIAAHPNRAIAFRSLTAWSDAPLIARLKAAGARLIPSRVVWVVDDVARDWLAKRDAKRDYRLIADHGYRIESPATLAGEDLARVHGLYRALYVGRHSRFNPDYQPQMLQAALASGFLQFQVLRGDDGRIDAFVACCRAGGVLASPLLGYDLDQPQDRGLYRMAMALPGVEAAACGLKVNHSAGAGTFKRNRGAKPELELMAVIDAHLPRGRRMGYAALARGLNAMAPALMRIAAA